MPPCERGLFCCMGIACWAVRRNRAWQLGSSHQLPLPAQPAPPLLTCHTSPQPASGCTEPGRLARSRTWPELASTWRDSRTGNTAALKLRVNVQSLPGVQQTSWAGKEKDRVFLGVCHKWRVCLGSSLPGCPILSRPRRRRSGGCVSVHAWQTWRCCCCL